jgi:hypothetical protein
MDAFAHHGPAGGPASSDGSNHVEDMNPEKSQRDIEASHTVGHVKGSENGSYLSDEDAMAQIIGVAILEFGVVLHRHVVCVWCPH